MKQEFTRLINVIQQTTNKIIDVNQKTSTLLQHEQYNNIQNKASALLFQLSDYSQFNNQPLTFISKQDNSTFSFDSAQSEFHQVDYFDFFNMYGESFNEAFGYFEESEFFDLYGFEKTKMEQIYEQRKHVFEYSLNGQSEWIGYTKADKITLNKHEYIQFRMNQYFFKCYRTDLFFSMFNAIGKFRLSGKFDIAGNLISLLSLQIDSVGDDNDYISIFENLFSIQPITDATYLKLPTRISARMYMGMFCGSSLKYPPITLPAIDLSNTTCAYQDMFYGCVNLIKMPEIKALKNGTADYTQMFYGCNNLRKTTCLPNVQQGGGIEYHYMFGNCENLNYIEVDFETWGNEEEIDNTNHGNTAMWVDNVATHGTFVKPSALPQKYGPSYIPDGWTVINK